MSFQEKYLKYKHKYLLLKTQLGGNICECGEPIKIVGATKCPKCSSLVNSRNRAAQLFGSPDTGVGAIIAPFNSESDKALISTSKDTRAAIKRHGLEKDRILSNFDATNVNRMIEEELNKAINDNFHDEEMGFNIRTMTYEVPEASTMANYRKNRGSLFTYKYLTTEYKNEFDEYDPTYKLHAPYSYSGKIKFLYSHEFTPVKMGRSIKWPVVVECKYDGTDVKLYRYETYNPDNKYDDNYEYMGDYK